MNFIYYVINFFFKKHLVTSIKYNIIKSCTPKCKNLNFVLLMRYSLLIFLTGSAKNNFLFFEKLIKAIWFIKTIKLDIYITLQNLTPYDDTT